jgi:hypothetical protein
MLVDVLRGHRWHWDLSKDQYWRHWDLSKDQYWKHYWMVLSYGCISLQKGHIVAFIGIEVADPQPYRRHGCLESHDLVSHGRAMQLYSRCVSSLGTSPPINPKAVLYVSEQGITGNMESFWMWVSTCGNHRVHLW